MKAIILADGRFPSHKIPCEILKNANNVICCDGAALNYIKSGREPEMIIGDIDSLPENIEQTFESRIVCVFGQKNNDLTKAVNWCVIKGMDEVVILGATGLRADHTIGNISLLARYGKKLKATIIDDYGIYTPIYKTTEFESFKGQYVSIFSIHQETKITLKGLKYRLHDVPLTEWWQGTLNESLGTKFSVIFTKGDVIVFQSHRE